MPEKSLCFPSTAALCLFLKEINLRNFVLLGKKRTLIAPFAADAIALASKKYSATLLQTPLRKTIPNGDCLGLLSYCLQQFPPTIKRSFLKAT
jgi:hypothetical protein